MLEAQDIQKLMDVLATKQDIQEMKEDIEELKLTMQGLVTAVDGLVTRVEALNQEYLVLKERDTRYERWFMQIAEKVGITLVP